MEDGAPTHRSQVAKEWCIRNNLEVIPHPPQSPDLNPIKRAWKQLKVLVNKRPTCPRNAHELWVAVQEEWQNIDMNFINSLIDSMPRRVEALYRAQGGPTRY